MTVEENLDFFGGVYGLDGQRFRDRAAAVVRTRKLEALMLSGVALVLVAAVLLASAGLAQAAPDEFRGLWVDAWGPDLWSASGVSTVISNARAGHLNALVCQVRPKSEVSR